MLSWRRNYLEANQTKIFTYIGFAKRSKNLILGVNSIKLLKRKVYLLLLCSTAVDNTKNEALSLANNFGCDILECNRYSLAELTLKENCKLAAICDKSLAAAVIKNINGDFKVLAGRQKG